MWLIVENSPENISLLKKLEFRFPDGDLLTRPLMDLETEGLFAVSIKLSNRNDPEYVNPLPNNFLEQIGLLRAVGMSTDDIIGVLKG